MILNTAIAEHKIKNEGKEYGDQRTVWGGGQVGIVGSKTECVGEKKEKAKNGDKYANKWC